MERLGCCDRRRVSTCRHPSRQITAPMLLTVSTEVSNRGSRAEAMGRGDRILEEETFFEVLLNETQPCSRQANDLL